MFLYFLKQLQQKMQRQINILNDNFEQAQGRVRTLQGHINYMKTPFDSIPMPNKNMNVPNCEPTKQDMNFSCNF